ncbi:MAG: ATP-binding protein [Clostridiales bacterium]|nr:ATP-binding protein [Candidatus Cacconaster stercorequi]
MTERKFEAVDGELYNAIGFVEEELEKHDCPMKVTMQITVAVEEIFVNIAHYAYWPNKGDMTLSVDATDCEVVIRFTDRGTPFDPLSRPDPDVSLSAEARRIGGLGIYMVKQTMDHVEYRYEDGQNILTLRKRIG